MGNSKIEVNIRGELDLEDVIIGDTFNYILEVEDEDGNPVDYSSGSEMEIRIFEVATNIRIITGTVTGGEIDISTAGEIAFDIPAETMEQLDAREYDYDIRFTDSAGDISTEFGGKFIATLGRTI